MRRYGASALYAPAPDIIAAIKASFGRDSKASEASIMAELAKVDLLLIDELGAQGGTEFERQSLHQIIDTRYRNMLPTIITSNLPGGELSAYIGDRALDRLRENGGQAVAFDWESARGAAE
ncbi:DNA replication protein DnaC [compost metagenome]